MNTINFEKMTWDEYKSSNQDTYLDDENTADQDVVFSNNTFIIRMFKTISHDNDHFFTGEDEDFAIIESKDDSFDSYLIYGCTLSEAINYVEAAGGITTIEELADYINAADEWPADVEDIIKANGWTSDTGEIYGICHNDEKRLIFDGDDTAIVISDNEEFTYDVMFNDETKSDTMGYHSSLQECMNFIDLYNGNPNVPYFGDYKGGIVQIINNETKEIVFTTEVK